MKEESNSRLMLKGTGKVAREVRDRKEELDRQTKGGEHEDEGGVRGARKKLMEKGKRAGQEKVPLKKNDVGKTH